LRIIRDGCASLNLIMSGMLGQAHMVGLDTIHHKAGVSVMVCPPMCAHMAPPLTTCWIPPIEFVDKLGGFMTSFVLLWCRSLVLFSESSGGVLPRISGEEMVVHCRAN
jgi:hypothetical protein